MKTISKYQLSEASAMRIVLNRLFLSVYKVAIIMMLCVPATVRTGYAQRYTRNKTADSMLYFFAGVSKVFAQRQAFDQWTRANFGITETYRPAVYLDLGIINRKYDFGADGNVGSAFETGGIYFGRRITGPQSPIGSWLNIGIGDFFSNFTNIMPPTYNKVPAGQQLTLSYNSFYISLVSKNYFNFLQYTARLGRNRIPVNMGFFVGAGWQPASRSWSYGYYDQDSVYHAQKLKPIPKLGKVQGTAGVFAGF